MRSTLIIAESLAAFGGLAFVLYDILLRRRLKRKDALILSEDENRVFLGFILRNTGIAVLVLALCALGYSALRWSRIIFIFGGILVGGLTAFGNLIFWVMSEDKYKVRPRLGEPIGGIFAGCLGFMFSLVFGTALGIIFYSITR